MKRTILFFALLLSFAATIQAQSLKTYTIRIQGMRCEDCVHKVMTAMSRDEGVDDMQFNLERRTATITYDPAKTTPDSIEAQLKGTRYYRTIKPYDPNEVYKRGKGYSLLDMRCQGCADRIAKALKNKVGIDSVATHLDPQWLFVRYDANKTCNDSIRATLLSQGFTPTNYYTSGIISYANFDIPADKANQDAVDAALVLNGIDDATVNPAKNVLAVTYVNEDTNVEKILNGLSDAGIKATLPKPHVCKEK